MGLNLHQPIPDAGGPQSALVPHGTAPAPAPALPRSPLSLPRTISPWQRATSYQPPSKTKLARCCSSRNWRGKAGVLFYNSISKFMQKKHPYNHGRFDVRLTPPAETRSSRGRCHCHSHCDVPWPTVALYQGGEAGSSPASLLHPSFALTNPPGNSSTD